MSKNWIPKEGWKVYQVFKKIECPYCGSKVSMLTCDVGGCDKSVSSGFPDNPRYHNICDEHAKEKNKHER